MKKPPLKGVNVDEAVAAGAAIYAGLKSKKNLNILLKRTETFLSISDIPMECSYGLHGNLRNSILTP